MQHILFNNWGTDYITKTLHPRIKSISTVFKGAYYYLRECLHLSTLLGRIMSDRDALYI